MKVIHITAGNIFGGVETHLVTLAKFGYLCADIEQHFGVCYSDRFSDTLAAAGAPVHFLGTTRLSRPWTIRQSRKRLESSIVRERFDAVICHMAWAHAIFGPAAKAAGTRSVLFLQNRVTGKYWIERWAARTAPDLILSVSKDTAKTSRNMYPNLAPQVVYSPMPEFETLSRVEIRPFVREELKTPQNACVIIQVSRMEAWKGHEPHLLALRQLRDNHDWFCWMVGGPQNDSEVRYFEGLQKLAHRLGISDRVRFLGQRKDVPRLLAAADVFCQPNTGTEGFSWVFMEAFAASLPIVTSAIGGADELVDACSGVLLPPGDADALARALEKFIGNPDLCQRMGEAGYRRVHQMCDRARQIQQLYQALLPFRTDSPVFKLP